MDAEQNHDQEREAPSSDTPPLPVVVPPEQLSEEALWDLARESLLRQGGNDDSHGVDLEETTHRLVRSIRAGRHLVVFDPATETAGVIKRP